MSLEGKVALVTGASSGIGAAVATALAAAGANIVAGARRTDRLAELAATGVETNQATTGANAATPGEIYPVKLDVSDEQSVRDAVAATAERFGRLDIVVNNAGVMLVGAVQTADTSEWNRMVQTNLLGSMYVAHAALPHLLDSKGTIIQTSSTSGRSASAGNGAYAATKFGINAFTEALRQEVTTQGVRVVQIAPGMVDTELASHVTDPAIQEMAAKLYASVRTLRPEDIAEAVLYAVNQPPHVAVNEILIRPTDQVA
ncbi:SDR family NAD(P)-dependent oxidoreductase [Kribbella sp. DT2]|uniref:SDR family NAD(P)-dependent oxidoreductase n=1 Tax=Kribbella sp. DT2 TaxID=3393427 RepID=UPI003CE864B6